MTVCLLHIRPSIALNVVVYLCVGTELSDDPGRGVSSLFVSAGFVWAVRQFVYASNRSHDVTNTSLGTAVNDVCKFLLSKVAPHTGLTRDFGVFGTQFLTYLLLYRCFCFSFF